MHRNTARIMAAEPLAVQPMLGDTQITAAVTLDPFGIKIFTVTGSGPQLPDISPVR
jgi:hypothetical protein